MHAAERHPARFQLFGYARAYAEEPVRQAAARTAPALMFTHAALGTAMLDPVAGAGSPGDHLHPGQAGYGASPLDLDVPRRPAPTPFSPLPIPLLVLMVVLPAGLVLVQALLGIRASPRNVLDQIGGDPFGRGGLSPPRHGRRQSPQGGFDRA